MLTRKDNWGNIEYYWGGEEIDANEIKYVKVNDKWYGCAVKVTRKEICDHGTTYCVNQLTLCFVASHEVAGKHLIPISDSAMKKVADIRLVNTQ